MIDVRRAFPRVWLLAAGLIWLVAAPAAAQQKTNDTAALPPTELGIKYRFSFNVSGGLDLDIFGDVVNFGVSCDTADDAAEETACRNQFRIVEVRNPAHYPDVYVATPVRFHASAGFGIFQRDELIVQVSRNRSAADPGIRVGRMLSAEGDRDLLGTFTTYEDLSIEGGLRHYFRATGRSKKYVNLTFGRRTVEAINADLIAAGADGNLGTVRFYDKSTAPTAAVVFGITFEPRKLIGVFLEAGFRWSGKLAGQDGDLGPLGLGALNDTGSRIFMPANVGILLRF